MVAKTENPDTFLVEYTNRLIIQHLLLIEDHFLEYNREPSSQCLSCLYWHLEKLIAYTSLECVKFEGTNIPACQELSNWATKTQAEMENLTQVRALELAKESREYRYKLVEGDISLRQVESLSLFSNVCTGNRCSNKSGGRVMKLSGETHIEAVIIGENSQGKYDLLVDTGATYVGLLPEQISGLGLHYIGEQEFGRAKGKVTQKIYSGWLQYASQRIPVIITTQSIPVIGYQALEALEVKVNPVDRKLEPVFFQSGGEKMAELKQDPILAEVASQICSTGICLGAKGKGKLPICSAEQKKALERCILDVKAKLPEKCKPYWSKPPEKQPEGCYNPYSVCRSQLSCRLGGSSKYERKVK
jgi:predicted aspartyl protease